MFTNFSRVILLFTILNIFGLNAQNIKNIEMSTPGTLADSISVGESANITTLILKGKLDARDFKTIRDIFINLQNIDIEETEIVAYTGMDGSNHDAGASIYYIYRANTLPEKAFSKYNSTKSTALTVKLPKTITTIGANAFYNNLQIKSIVIPDNITTISDYAFWRCTKLKRVDLGKSVSYLGIGCFSDCTLLTEIIFSPALTEIRNNAFSGCLTLTELNLPNTVIKISMGAFGSCMSLKSLTLPESIRIIDFYAFSNCVSLETVTFGNQISLIGNNCFSGCTGLLNISLPNSVKKLDFRAFYDCTSLKSIKMSKEIYSIDFETFYNCISLTEIEIPEKVRTIGYDVFGKSGIKTIYSYLSTPFERSENDIFLNFDKTVCSLYIPTGTRLNYLAANEWKNFFNVFEMETEVPEIIIKNQITPNIVTEFFKISDISEESSIGIYDINGALLKTQQVNNNDIISIRNLISGIYIVKIFSKRLESTYKIVKL